MGCDLGFLGCGWGLGVGGCVSMGDWNERMNKRYE